MGMPAGIGVIDLMMGIPEPGRRDEWYSFLKPNLRDAQSQQMAMPAQYLITDIPEDPTDADMIAWTLDQMDGCGVDRALIGVSLHGGIQNDAIARHPDRFFGCLHVDPNGGMQALREISRARDELGIRGVSLFPSGCNPPVPINDKRMYPVYVNEVSRQLLEDKPIWENKEFVERPALADTDGPFLQFRQWASQFYADPVD